MSLRLTVWNASATKQCDGITAAHSREELPCTATDERTVRYSNLVRTEPRYLRM